MCVQCESRRPNGDRCSPRPPTDCVGGTRRTAVPRDQRVTRTLGGGSPDFVFCGSWHENGPAGDLVGFEFLVDLGDIVKLEFFDLRLDAARFGKRNSLR